MMTPESHARKRRARWGIALVCGLLLGTATATTAAADPAARPTLKTIKTLPHTGHGDDKGNGDGGRGTVKKNTAVAAACNAGRPIHAPQWYSIGEKTTGSIRVSAKGVWYPRGAVEEPTGTAIVDHWTGRVLACTGETLQRQKKWVDVVAYLAEPFSSDEEPYYSLDLNIVVDRVSTTAPANDLMANAQPITALPFSARVDTAKADGDGPWLMNYNRCLLSAIDPQQASTVWYRYSPTKDEPAPVVSATPATNWPAGNSDGGWGLRTGILELLPDGQTRLVENADDWDCDTPVPLEKGKTYLFGVYYTWDSYYDSILATGGPVDVTVTAR